MEALKESVRLLFWSIEGEHICYGDDEIGNDEGAPEADEHACEPAQERFREEVAIAHGCQGHNHAPHGIAKLVEVLLRRQRHGTFEYLEGITKEQDGDCQRNENWDERALLHVCLKWEEKIRLAIIHKAHPLRARVHELRGHQQAPQQYVYAHEAKTHEQIVQLVLNPDAILVEVFAIVDIIKIRVWREEKEQDLHSEGLPPPGTQQVVELGVQSSGYEPGILHLVLEVGGDN